MTDSAAQKVTIVQHVASPDQVHVARLWGGQWVARCDAAAGDASSRLSPHQRAMPPVAYHHTSELAARINVKSWAEQLRRGTPAVAVLRNIQRSVDHYMTRKQELMRNA